MKKLLLSLSSLCKEALPARVGTGQLLLDVRALPPGHYSYRLVTDGRPGPAKHLVITR